jgi:hypothetical protein
MPLWRAHPHPVPHDAAEESEDGECENGISITAADAEGIEEPKKVKIVLLVHNMWAKFCPGLLEKSEPKMDSKFFNLEFTPQDGLAKIKVGREAATLVGKEMLLSLRGMRGHSRGGK